LSPAPQLGIVADPGDEIEISLNALWGSTAAGPSGFLDICTWDPVAAVAINWLTGLTALSPSIGWDVVGAAGANGLPSLFSVGTSTSVADRIAGVFRYPVQPADIKGGLVTFQVRGGCTTTATRTIAAGSVAGWNFVWQVTNVGPASYLAVA
jgi:hypothetical protein